MSRQGMGVFADRRGGIAILGAIAMTSMVGMAAFAIDIGAAYTQRAQLQKVADSAAMAGALSWVKAGTTAAAIATIRAVVIAHGWPASVIQQPSLFYLSSSPRNAANSAIQVKLAAPASLTLGRVISGAVSLTTNAWAIVELGPPVQMPACLVSLTSLTVGSKVNVSGCAAAANATGSNAITIDSGSTLTASTIDTPGGVVNNGTISGIIKTGAAPAIDPYAGTGTQAANGFKNCQNYANQPTLSPGCWSNVTVNGGMTLQLAAGAFFFTGLNVNSGGRLIGTSNVTIVTQTGFSPNADVTLTAPSTGPWAGIAIYAMGGINVNSGVRYAVNGAIYSPTAPMILDSGSFNQSACTYLVGQSITFNSGARLVVPQANCTGFAYPAPTVSGAPGKIAMVQ